MKKLTNARLFTMTILGLGVFAMISLTSCDGSGDAANQQETDRIEEATPSDNAEHPAAESEHPKETPVDTTDTNEGTPQENEHPTGGDEHPK